MQSANPLTGLRCVAVYRASDPKSVEKMPQQREAVHHFIEQHEMVLVHEHPKRLEEAEAVSGSVGEHKETIYELRDIKVNGELDFEVMVFWDWSRFTRTGTLDGNRVLADLADEDIMVVTVKEGLANGKDSWIRRDMSLRESEAYAETLSVNVSRGYQYALEAGEIPHCTITPYGTDRLYVAANGTPQFILRDVGGGEKAKLDPATRVEIERLKHSVNAPAVIKQPNQRIVLVKGPPDEVEIVREIFYLRYMKGFGASRIASELNSRGVPGPDGKRWFRGTVHRLYKNWLYLGKGNANQASTGTYARRAKHQPIEYPTRRKPGRRKDKTGRRKNIPPLPRDRADWLAVPYDDLKDLLERELREVVIRVLSEEATRPKKSNGDRHFDSSYILKGVLTTKQESLPMTGLPSKGTKGRLYRYYSVNRVISSPEKKDKFKTRLPADLAEGHVISALASVLTCPETIDAGVRAYVERRVRENKFDGRVLHDLSARKKQALDEYETIYEVFGKHGREAMKTRAAQLEARIDDLTRQINAAGQTLPFKPEQTDQIIRNIQKQCREARALLGQRSSPAFKELLHLLVPRMTFDVVTKEVEIEIALPEWAISVEPKIAEQLRLAHDHVVVRGRETRASDVVFLAKFACRHSYIKRQPCLACRRYPLAA